MCRKFIGLSKRAVTMVEGCLGLALIRSVCLSCCAGATMPQERSSALRAGKFFDTPSWQGTRSWIFVYAVYSQILNGICRFSVYARVLAVSIREKP